MSIPFGTAFMGAGVLLCACDCYCICGGTLEVDLQNQFYLR
jgi:hypothetical protein